LPTNSKTPLIHKLLIICCKFAPTTNDIQYLNSRLGALESKTEEDNKTWQAFQYLVSRHGVLPLAYKAIYKYATNTTPQEYFDTLKEAFMANVRRNMLNSAELVRVITLLEDNGIEALAFKGPSLSQLAHGDIISRQYGDIDILVNIKDVTNAGALISKREYRPDYELSFLSNEAFLNVSSDLGFWHTKNGIYLELHWSLSRTKLSRGISSLILQREKTEISIQDKLIKTLPVDLLFLYLCVHGSKHLWGRMMWIVDIDRLIRRKKSIDWEKINEAAQITKNETSLLLGLLISHHVLATPVPKIALDRIAKNRKLSVLLKLSLQELLMPPKTENHGIKQILAKYYFHFLLKDDFSERLRYLFSLVFKITPDDVLNVNLPKHMSFLYILIRPFRLGKKYIFRT